MILIFGGIGKDVIENEMIQLDIKSMIWDRPIIHSSIPPMRYACANAYCTWNQRWYIIAGLGGKPNLQKCKPLSDVWYFDVKAFTWKELNI